MLCRPLPEIEVEAIRAEALGYTGLWSTESTNDPFLPVLLAARSTSAPELGTCIAVALARNPMTMAVIANDLHAYSGRFILGLGSQVRAHITRRFGMPWSNPAERMLEFVGALKAIWSSWNDGSTLDFQGTFYSHTLMPNAFRPAPNPHGQPRIYLAGVGPRMTEVAGQVADGFLAHPFMTEEYFRTVTIPALARGAERSSRDLSTIELTAPGFVVTGSDEDEVASASRAVRTRIGFYASTPAYLDVLQVHGWSDLQREASSLVKAGRAGELAELVDDSVLRQFAVVASPDAVCSAFREMFGDVAQRVVMELPYEVSGPTLAQIAEGIS
jgi:probable F420-dependent oxidoreductase